MASIYGLPRCTDERPHLARRRPVLRMATPWAGSGRGITTFEAGRNRTKVAQNARNGNMALKRNRPRPKKVSRSGDSPYEFASQCHQLKLKGYTGHAAGLQLGVGEAAVNSYHKAFEFLHPEILDAWRDSHPAAAVKFLYEIMIRSHEDQLALWGPRMRQVGNWDRHCRARRRSGVAGSNACPR